MKGLFEYLANSRSKKFSLVVGWNGDIGKIGPFVTDFLNKKLGINSFCEIELENFFPMDGVAIEDDCIQFPESKFFYDQRSNLLIFKSDRPNYYHYKFLNFLLDVPMRLGQIKELYTINGMVSQIPHTSHRKIFVVFNNLKFIEILHLYNLEGLTWEGPPAISSLLLWVAQRRKVPGLSLWLEVPFYLAALEDFYAIKLVLSFLNLRFNLNLEITEVEAKIEEQNEKIEKLRIEDKEVNKYIGLLESGLELNEVAQLRLAQKIYEHLKINCE